MEKKYLFGLALLLLVGSMVAGSIVASAAASEAAEWLATGAKFSEALSMSIAGGEILFEDSFFKIVMRCSTTLDGTITGNTGTGTITAALNSAGNTISHLEPLLCRKVAGSPCEESTTDVEWWPLNMPWKMQVVLLVTLYETLLYGVNFEISCLIVGFRVETACSMPYEAQGGAGFLTENGMSGVVLGGLSTSAGECLSSKESKAQINFLPGSLLSSPGVTISASE